MSAFPSKAFFSLHPKTLERAMLNELSEFKAVLYGYSLSIQSQHTPIAMSSAGVSINIISANNIHLSKALYESAQRLYVSTEQYSQKTDTYERVYEPLALHQEYNITAHLVSKSDAFEKVTRSSELYAKSQRDKILWLQSFPQESLAKEILKNVSLLVVCEDVVMRYDLVYTSKFEAANTYVEIQEIKNTALSEEDYQHIKDTHA